MWPLYEFQYGSRTSRSTKDLLINVSDRITSVFNMSRAIPAIALDISKAFDRVWYASLLHKLKTYRFSGWLFNLVLSFLSNRQLRVIQAEKFKQEYSVNAGASNESIFILMVFPPYIDHFHCDAIWNIAIYADHTTLLSRCGQTSDSWYLLELVSKPETDWRDTVDWRRR